MTDVAATTTTKCPAAPPDARQRRWALLLVVGMSAVYFSMWWNAYLSPTEGGELFFVKEFVKGRLPYRDYYYSAQPLAFLWPILVTRVFGDRLVVLWALGVALRLTAAGVLFWWLARRWSWRDAALAVVAATVISSGDIADFPNWYQHQGIAFAVFGAYCASRVIGARPPARTWRWSLAAGMLLAVAFLIKQTIGILVGFSVVAVTLIALVRNDGWRRATRELGALALGLALPTTATLAWLWRVGSFRAYLDQVYLRGPSSKGGALTSLLRPLTFSISNPQFWAPAILAFVVLAAVLLFALWRRAAARLPWELITAGAIGTALLGGKLAAILGADSRTPALACAYLTLAAGLLMAFRALASFRGRGRADGEGLLLGAVAFSTAYSLSISWPAFEAMLFPGLAIGASALLALGLPDRVRQAVRGCTVLALFALMVVSTMRKHEAPYTWGLWMEPPLSASTMEPRAPELQGFLVSPPTAEFLDDASAQIRAHSTADERVLVYPHMPLLYALADRRPAGFAFMHWLDVCPDYVAEADAARLRADPPAVILSMDLPAAFYDNEEVLFRNGRPSGQRALLSAIQSLLPRYELVRTYRAPGTSVPIRLWARRR